MTIKIRMNEMWFYLYDPVEEKTIALDSRSGGYPHLTNNPNFTEFFSSKEDADKYRETFKNSSRYESHRWKIYALAAWPHFKTEK